MTWPPWSRYDARGLARYVTADARKWLTPNIRPFDAGADPEGRMRVVRAIYESLAQLDISYTLEEYNPSEVVQQIREPADILRSPHEGTCLDLAALFCGLALGNELLPVIVVLDGHALALVSLEHGLRDWDGYRPEREWFDRGPIDDADRFVRLVGLVDAGQYVAVECTGFASSDRLAAMASASFPETVGRADGKLPFARAMQAGREQLTLAGRPLEFALDVALMQYGQNFVPYSSTADRGLELPIPREAPPGPSVLIAREPHLDAVRHGTAGVGKSALAQAAAVDPEIEASFPDGTFWFDLRAIDAMTALEHIALAFGYTVAEHVVLASRAAQVRSLVRDKQLLVVLDGVWDRASVEHLQPTGARARVLVTTIDGGLADGLGDAIYVPPLDDDDAERLLASLIDRPLSGADRRRLRHALPLFGGLPLALELAAMCIKRDLRTDRASVADFVDTLDRETTRLTLGTSDKSVRATFESTYRHALDDRRRELFARLGAFRAGPLDLGAIASSWEVDDDEATTHLRELVDLSLLEESRRYSFRFPPLLRDYATKLFADLPASEQIRVHERAAGYYRRWINTFEVKQHEQTACWYRFERPEWQEREVRLLFHLSQLPGRNTARVGFARLYFDAFWWWGSYVRFEYCEQLLAEWGRTHPHPDDRRWYDVLAQFAHSYPIGAAKRSQGDWIGVEASLSALRTLAEIDRAPDAIAEDEARRLWAVTGLFLAQAGRYLDRADDADTTYTQAIDVLLARAEYWDAAWALFDQAAMLVEQKKYDDADAAWRRSLAACVEHEILDTELRSNLYRIQADIAWARGALVDAFDRYGRAVFYAYRFQATPHPPDVYTLTFYQEMIGRTRSRFAELLATGRFADVQTGVDTIQRLWSLAGAVSGDDSAVGPAEEPSAVPDLPDAAVIVTSLFPAEPQERKLTARSARYAKDFAADVAERTDGMAAALRAQAWSLA
jgi:NB-ARC domain-containing protein